MQGFRQFHQIRPTEMLPCVCSSPIEGDDVISSIISVSVCHRKCMPSLLIFIYEFSGSSECVVEMYGEDGKDDRTVEDEWRYDLPGSLDAK
ncbi:hypothetical protein LWI28_007497 [Acer negundo]|uniref:Uncharacterized protein n=1 Tax=Acer negundo TaxID=4023 RepID=A0AAD5ITS9_ACENE|nr:hypothetical protein LWI28_007497 [Acer negundo]